jgi:NADH-quinone oxidoreductase subunit E
MYDENILVYHFINQNSIGEYLDYYTIRSIYFKSNSQGTFMKESCENIIAKEMFTELDTHIISLNFKPDDERRRGHLIEVLHKAQHIFGYLPDSVQTHIAEKMNLHHSDISGVISFYNYFTTTPKGKHKIAICMGTACFVKGADKILDEFEKHLKIKAGQVTSDKKFSIDIVRCIGACGLAPVITVGEKVYGKISKDDVKKILEEYRD